MNDINNQIQTNKNKTNIKLLLWLVIVIFLTLIGGTYAYFTTGASNNGITGNMGQVNLTLDVTKVLPETNKVDNILVLNYSELADSLNNKCIDNNGEFALCQLYKINLSNNIGGLNTNVKGSIAFNNTTTPNLSWIYLGNSYSASTNYTSAMLGDTFNLSSSTYTSFIDEYLLTSGKNVDFYILVWINESEEEQTDEGSYSGTIRFEDANGNGVTATFN